MHDPTTDRCFGEKPFSGGTRLWIKSKSIRKNVSEVLDVIDVCFKEDASLKQ